MCYQTVELYAACRCLYYQHAVDRCAAYGMRGHSVIRRPILVGYACEEHDLKDSRYYENNAIREGLLTFPTTARANISSKAGPERHAGTGAQLPPGRHYQSTKPLKLEPSEATRADQGSFMLHRPMGEVIDGSASDDKPEKHGKEKERKPKDPTQLRSDTAVKPMSNRVSFKNAYYSAHSVVGPNSVQHEAPKNTFKSIQEDNRKVTGQSSKEKGANQSLSSRPAIPIQSLSFKSQPSTSLGSVVSPNPDFSESDMSETESVVLTLSSTSSVDMDALEAIFHRLLHYGDLRFLWPQVVRRCCSLPRSLRTIERFLRRYADDLAKLAARPVSDGGSENPSKQVQIKASLFLQRSRLNLARRIFEAHCEASELASPDEAVEYKELDHQARAEEVDWNEAEDPFNYVYIISEPFLFDTDPILYLEASVKAFVMMQRPQPSTFSLRHYVEISFENILARLTRAPVPQGKRRVSWICKCGRELYDDFIELRPGAVHDLGNFLRQYSKEVFTEVINGVDPGQAPNRKHGLTLLWHGLQTIIGLLKVPDLPRNHRNYQNDIELGHCPKVSNSVRTDHNFMLLCIPFQRWAAKLHQPEICRINSDQELMQVLRHYYSSQRGRSAWTRLRKLQSIDFIQFEVYKSGLVDLQTCPSIPSDNMNIDYTYDPMPAETMPPIGSNLLMHLFEHPEDAEVIPVLYRKIPKKLRQRLEPCSRKGSVGWGLQLVEGMNWFMVFVYGCIGFLLTLITAIIWATIKNDVQGAFAISGFMIAFLLFCGGIARAEIHV